MIRLLVILLLLTLASAAYVFLWQDYTLTEDGAVVPKTKAGTVPWELFMTTKEKEKKISFPDGGYGYEVTPIFSDKLKELDGAEVTLHGFMFPLQQGKKHSNFLLGPFPPSCPFHYHAPASMIIEIKTKNPIKFSWDELKLTGTLKLMKNHPDGSFYILKDAVILK